MKKGERVELLITDIGEKREGVSRLDDGRVVFVRNTFPGDRVLAEITGRKKSYLLARQVGLLKPSPHRVSSECPYVPICGGCAWRELDYEFQLEQKSATVQAAFQRLGGFSDLTCRPILPAPATDYYRNKMEFTFSDQKWVEVPDGTDPGFGIGLHPQGMFSKVIDLEHCRLQSPLSSAIVNTVRDSIHEIGATAYNQFNQSGLFRFLSIREGRHTQDRMVNLVTSEAQHPHTLKVAAKLQKAHPEITTIVNNVTRRRANVATGEKEFILHGPGYIRDRIGSRTFRISANSFFQTNTEQAGRLYQLVREYANLSGSETIYDLYAGAGTITIYLSDQIREGIGFELVEDAVIDAGHNLELNGVNNLRFVAGDIKHEIQRQDLPQPDLVVLDPPRSGMHPDVTASLLQRRPRRIVYVSCNPATQARDARLLVDGGYRLREITPVDMFPHTRHIEAVALLELS